MNASIDESFRTDPKMGKLIRLLQFGSDCRRLIGRVHNNYYAVISSALNAQIFKDIYLTDTPLYDVNVQARIKRVK